MRSGRSLLAVAMLLLGVSLALGQQAGVVVRDTAPWHIAKNGDAVARLNTARDGAAGAADAGPQKYLHIEVAFKVPRDSQKRHKFQVVNERGEQVGELWGWNDERSLVIFEGNWGNLVGLWLEGNGHKEPLFKLAVPEVQVARTVPVVPAPRVVERPVARPVVVDRPAVVDRPVIVDRPTYVEQPRTVAVDRHPDVVVDRGRDVIVDHAPARVVIDRPRDVVVTRAPDVVVGTGRRNVVVDRGPNVVVDGGRRTVVVDRGGTDTVVVNGTGGAVGGNTVVIQGDDAPRIGVGPESASGAGPTVIDLRKPSPSSPSSPDAGKPDNSKPDTSTPDNSKPDSSTPDNSKPSPASPDNSKPDSSTPDSSTPDNSKPSPASPDSSKPDSSPPSPPDNSKPDTSTPDNSKPDSSTPDNSKPSPASPDSSKPDSSPPSPPDNSKPDNSKPDNSKPDNSKPDNSKPDNSKPDNSTPDNSTPDNSKPDSSTPDNSKPSPDGGKPDNSQPDTSKPSPSSPDNSKPGDCPPDSGKPDNSKPGDCPPDNSKPSPAMADGSKPSDCPPGSGDCPPDGSKPSPLGPVAGKPSDCPPGKEDCDGKGPAAAPGTPPGPDGPASPAGPDRPSPSSRADAPAAKPKPAMSKPTPDQVALNTSPVVKRPLKPEKPEDWVVYVATGSEATPGSIYQIDQSGRVLGKIRLPQAATGMALHRDSGLVLALPRAGGKIVRIDDAGQLATILEKDRVLTNPVDVAVPPESDTIVVADNIADVLATTTVAGAKPRVHQRFEGQKWAAPEMSVAVTKDKHVIFSSSAEPGVYFYNGSDRGSRPILPASGGLAADTKTVRWAASQEPNLVYVYEGQERVGKLRLPPGKGLYRKGLLSFSPDGSLCVACRDSETPAGGVGLLTYDIDKDEVRSLFPWDKEQMTDFVVGPRMVWERTSSQGPNREF